MASRARARAPPLRRRESQWAGLGRAADDGVGGEAGWGGVRCYGLTAGETDQRRAAERRSPRSPHPAAYGARKNAAPGFPIPTFPIPLPMNLRTRTACPSTGMNLRPRPRPRPRSPSYVLFLRPWRLRTPLPSRPFRSQLARLAPCCRTLFLACPPLRCCSSCLPESWPSLPPALARLSHSSCTTNGWELFLRSERRAENGGPGLSGDGRGRGRGRGRLVYMT